MLLEQILETEDLESLKLLKPKITDKIIQEFVDFIIKTESFSAFEIGKNLSIAHAGKYIELCNRYTKQKIDNEIQEQIIKSKQAFEDI